jgi:hypothetical protein
MYLLESVGMVRRCKKEGSVVSRYVGSALVNWVKNDWAAIGLDEDSEGGNLLKRRAGDGDRTHDVQLRKPVFDSIHSS